MRKCGILFFLCLILAASFIALPIQAVPHRAGLAHLQRQVLILDMPRFVLADISPKYPALFHLLNQGAVGVMTTTLPDPITPEKVYLAFNSGIPLKPPGEESGLVFDVAEMYQGVPAGDLYRSFTGSRPFPDGSVYVGLAKLFQTNEGQAWPSIGLMGRVLHRHGFKTAVIGNADADIYNRSAALMLMDERGRIDYGAVGQEMLQVDHRFPFGFRSNLEGIWQKWLQIKSKAGVIVISLGDLERLERYDIYLNAERQIVYRRQALAAYDRFLARLMPEINPATTLTVLLTAAPPQKNESGNTRLNPLILYGPGFHRSLLFSEATRRPGIITGSDLPSTILQFLGIHDSGFMNGRQLKAIPGRWSKVKQLEKQLSLNFNCRWILLPIYGYLLIGIVLLLIIGMIFWPEQLFLFRGLTSAYLFLLTFPAVFLVEALLNPMDWSMIISITLSIAALIFGISHYRTGGNPLRILSRISLITLILVFCDGCLNGYPELFSFLGYSAVTGARFYGIGNEYMGLILGAYIILISLNLEHFKKHPILLWMATYLLTILLAHPELGSNIGGGITALIGLSVTNYLWLDSPVRWKEVARLVISVCALLLIIGLWDFFINGPAMTHFGRFIGMVKEQGFPTLINTLNHKWNLNLQLIGSTPWTFVLLIVLLGVPFFYYRSPAPVARLLQKYPAETRGFLGLVITALIGLLVNDSGIVTGTTLFIFGLIELFVLILKEWGLLKIALNKEMSV